MVAAIVLLLLAGCDEGVESSDTAKEASPIVCDEDGDGYTTSDGDCDESTGQVHPGATEECDGIDNNCDGTVDEGLTATWYQDTDDDKFGTDDVSVVSCDLGSGWVLVEGDCDDRDAAINPGAVETCDEVDNNCDGAVDEGLTGTWYLDADGDAFGDPDLASDGCPPRDDWVSEAFDCDDDDATINPDAIEVCDGIDNDCNGGVDEGLLGVWYHDGDGDSYGDPSTAIDACSSPGASWVNNNGDCDDAEAYAWSGATEVCDRIDNNCDGSTDEGLTSTWYEDADGDSYGDPATATVACTSPGTTWVSNSGDCFDGNAATWTGAAELCDGVDNDCNTLVDDSPIDGVESPADVDGDGFGAEVATTTACVAVDNTLDCDDSDASEPVVVDDDSPRAGWDGSAMYPFLTVQEGIEAAGRRSLVPTTTSTPTCLATTTASPTRPGRTAISRRTRFSRCGSTTGGKTTTTRSSPAAHPLMRGTPRPSTTTRTGHPMIRERWAGPNPTPSTARPGTPRS